MTPLKAAATAMGAPGTARLSRTGLGRAISVRDGSSALLLLLTVASVIACGPPPAGMRPGATPSRGIAGAILREDRVTIGRGTTVRAVAVARRFVYAATGDAVIVYDRDRRSWLPPFIRDGGFDPTQVRALAVDPDDDSAWLLASQGAWTLNPVAGFVTRAPAGPLPARLRPGSLDAVYREFPALQGFAPLLARDAESLQSYPVVAGARAPDRTEVWLGTAGGGLLQVDPLFNSAESRPYGLAVSGAGALARAADGVWVAPASRTLETRLAVTFVARDLQRFRWLDDASRRGFGGARATSLAVDGPTMWMGTTHGLLRVPLSGGGLRTFTPLAGLPADAVWTVLSRRDGLWIGTEGGLAWLPADSAARGGRVLSHPDASGLPVRALLATGDTVWVGTDGGLLLRPPGEESRLVRPAASPFSARLRAGIRALAHADSTVFVASRGDVLTFDVRSGRWSDPWAAVPWRAVGDIDVLAADARTVWAGGAFGVIAVDRETGGSRIARAGSDLPDAVTGILLDGAYAWIATLGGVVRVRRASDGLLP
ncbi:MAG: hypothetical protein P3B98_13635 [Gemmatimonadota bacterium]|nr:hypothetical protein [Gemmatimonadota bacterium]